MCRAQRISPDNLAEPNVPTGIRAHLFTRIGVPRSIDKWKPTVRATCGHHFKRRLQSRRAERTQPGTLRTSFSTIALLLWRWGMPVTRLPFDLIRYSSSSASGGHRVKIAMQQQHNNARVCQLRKEHSRTSGRSRAPEGGGDPRIYKTRDQNPMTQGRHVTQNA